MEKTDIQFDLQSLLKNSDTRKKPIPFWFWNWEPKDMDDERIRTIMRRSLDESGYGGFCIIPNKIKGYLTEEFFEKYRIVLEEAEKYKIKISMYDENGFPSGAANGLFGELYPENTVKRLDKTEWEVTGPIPFEQFYKTAGDIMGVVLFQKETFECRDITSNFSITTGKLRAEIPTGNWTVMLFECVKDGSPIVDYLNHKSVKKFIHMTHDAYYSHFKEYFGKVIDTVFYDEPTMWGFEGPWIPGGRIVIGGRMWTEEFNVKYEAAYHESPVTMYPALWYDMGELTGEVRKKLFYFRSELFQHEYIDTMAAWCEAHHVQLQGHTWEENFENPTGTVGDLMKVFEKQQIPGIDSIFNYQYVTRSLKIVASSAYNWDKPYVMCETYGAMKENDALCDILYREAMDEFAKGINHIIPHAIWYTDHPGITPELSYRNRYGELLPDYTSFISRLTTLLEGGRHVADIAVIYPIDDLQSVFHFTQNNNICVPDYSNYMGIGEQLSLDIRKDFTYLHPQVITEKCIIKQKTKTLYLDNRVNFEEYKVLILPAMTIIDYEVLEKVYEFYKSGGNIISVGKLPCAGTRSDQTKKVLHRISEIFGNHFLDNEICWNYNEGGGNACFIPESQRNQLDLCLNKMVQTFDVRIGKTEKLSGGTLSYIHKIVNNRNLYYFANSSDCRISVPVSLRGRLTLWSFNPHNGEIVKLPFRNEYSEEQQFTEILLELAPISSIFVISE